VDAAVSAPRGGRTPAGWWLAHPAWRVVPHVTTRRVDLLLRWRSAAGLPFGRDRFRAMGLPDEAVGDALRRVRALADWDAAWVWAAQRFLGEARRQIELGSAGEAMVARRRAALAYHAATLLAGDRRTLRALRASATSLFAQTLTGLRPALERVEVPWRTSRLPALLARPWSSPSPAPLAVLLNGSSTAKEETVLWSSAFLDRGIAVLALDWPGTGEAAQRLGLTADCDDLTDGLLGFAAADPALDEARVALVGFSLGGALAVLAAAGDRRIAAVVAVTPPYDATRWLPLASPFLRQHLAGDAGIDASLDLAVGFALPPAVRRLRAPLLVFGAGRDLVVPPVEAVRLAAGAGDLATLVWWPAGGHGLYAHLGEWTSDAACWLRTVLGESGAKSTGVDRPGTVPLPTPAATLTEADNTT